MKSGIYAILNIVNGKVYVGQAFNFQKRWKNHRIALQFDKHHNRYLQAAYDKNGQFAFIYVVLEYCEAEILTEREQFWMDELKSADREFGYNLSPVAGRSTLGVVHTDEVKQAWSVQRKGKTRSEEAKAAIKAGWVKRKANGPVSEETKLKLSISHMDKKPSEETRAKMSVSKIGNTFRLGKFTGKRSPEVIANVLAGRRLAARRREKDLMWSW